MAACPAVLPAITYCEPMPAWRHELYDAHQFERSHVDINEADDAQRRIAYSDFKNGMHREVHKLGRVRRLDVPIWGTNDTALRRLLCFHFLRRAGIRVKQRIPNDANEQRKLLAEAQAAIDFKIVPKLETELRNLCHRFVTCTDAVEKSRLARQAQGKDTLLRVSKLGAGLLASIVCSYYRRGLSSVELAEELHIKPGEARQVLHRMAISWAKMNGEKFVPQQWGRRSESERQNDRAAMRRYRARRRLERLQAELAELESGREQFISGRVDKARRIYAKRLSKAQGAVDAARAHVLALAERFL